jgi:hypothetical protein
LNKAARRGIQNYLKSTPVGKKYGDLMDEMHDMFTLAGKDSVLDNKVIAEKGKSAISLWIKKNPVKSKLIFGTIGTGILGAILGEATGILPK